MAAVGFLHHRHEARRVQYHAVVDRFPVPVPLDPIAAAVFAAAFVATLLATQRRPAAGIAALAFSAPFAYYHDLFGTSITFPKVVLAALVCGLAVRPSALATFGDGRVRRLLMAMAVVICAILASGVFAEHHAPVVREAFKWLEYAVAVAAVFAAYRLDPDDALVIRAWMLSIALVCASALAEEFIGASSGLLIAPGVVPRIAGVLEGPNQLAGYLETTIALLAAWTMFRPSRSIQILLSVAVITLALTFSRGGWAGCAVAIVALVAVYRERSRPLLRPLLTGAVTGFAADAGWYLAAKTVAALRVPFIGADYAGGVGNRSELWRAAWFFFRTHPVFGIGAGNYELELARAGLPNVRTHANNWYLQQLAEGGVVLFGATLVFIGSALAPLVRAARSSPWTAAALAATLALCTHQLADYIVFYPKAGLPWMLVVALGFAASVPRECAG